MMILSSLRGLGARAFGLLTSHLPSPSASSTQWSPHLSCDGSWVSPLSHLIIGGTFLGQARLGQLSRCHPMQTRGVFGAPQRPMNLQIHTHDKYKVTNPQPDYNFLVGRFVIDREGIIWHRPANSSHGRHHKTSSQMSRLKRLTPLAPAFASKLRKLGFDRRYWQDPDPATLPGYYAGSSSRAIPEPSPLGIIRRSSYPPGLSSGPRSGPAPTLPRPREKSKPDKRTLTELTREKKKLRDVKLMGEPALRPH